LLASDGVDNIASKMTNTAVLAEPGQAAAEKPIRALNRDMLYCAAISFGGFLICLIQRELVNAFSEPGSTQG